MEHYCPYCSKKIDPKEILFVDSRYLGKGRHLEDRTDAARARFEQLIVRTGSITVTPKNADPDAQERTNPQFTISLEERPPYLYHYWTRPDNRDVPYYSDPQTPAKVEEGEDFPRSIRVYRKNGLTPKMLEPQNEDQEADDTGLEDLGSELAEDVEQSEEDEATMTLYDRACPHCHSILPRSFGQKDVETIRISMLGGTSSGKTTYMTAVVNLLCERRQLPKRLIKKCKITQESERYFKYLLKCQEYNEINATKLEDADQVQFVFPFVMEVETEGHKPFIMIINDIPGEAMRLAGVLAEYRGLTQADALIMLIDPFQFDRDRDNEKKKKELAKEQLRQIKTQDEEDDAEEDFGTDQIRKQIKTFAQDPFRDTIENMQTLIAGDDFKKLRCVTFVLNKLDLLYAGENHDLSAEAGEYSYINNRPDVNEEHEGAVDLAHIRGVSRQVVDVIEKKLGYDVYSDEIKGISLELQEAASRNGIEKAVPAVYTLYASNRSWNAGTSSFVCDHKAVTRMVEGENREVDDLVIDVKGYRLAEPVLYTMARLDLIESKDEEKTTPPQPAPSWLKRIFGNRR